MTDQIFKAGRVCVSVMWRTNVTGLIQGSISGGLCELGMLKALSTFPKDEAENNHLKIRT